MEVLRLLARMVLPRPLRLVYWAVYNYVGRILFWRKVFVFVRGRSLLDQIKLIVSALLSPILSFKDFGRWLPPQLAFNTKVYVKGVGNFDLRPRTDDLWHVLPCVEPEVYKALKAHLKPGGTFIDAGTNVGLYTVVASRLVGERGQVISFEMMPDTASRLRNHIAINDLKNVKVIEKGLSAKNGQMVKAKVPVGFHGQASIASESEMRGKWIEVEIETTTLSDSLSEVQKIDLMKMDLEGMEYAVVNASKDVLAKVDHLIFENSGDDRSVHQVLEGNQFEVSAMDGRNYMASSNNARP